MQMTDQQTLGTLLEQMKSDRGLKRGDLCAAARITPSTWDKIIDEKVPDIVKMAHQDNERLGYEP